MEVWKQEDAKRKHRSTGSSMENIHQQTQEAKEAFHGVPEGEQEEA